MFTLSWFDEFFCTVELASAFLPAFMVALGIMESEKEACDFLEREPDFYLTIDLKEKFCSGIWMITVTDDTCEVILKDKLGRASTEDELAKLVDNYFRNTLGMKCEGL